MKIANHTFLLALFWSHWPNTGFWGESSTECSCWWAWSTRRAIPGVLTCGRTIGLRASFSRQRASVKAPAEGAATDGVYLVHWEGCLWFERLLCKRNFIEAENLPLLFSPVWILLIKIESALSNYFLVLFLHSRSQKLWVSSGCNGPSS